jgi:hypothetical protein
MNVPMSLRTGHYLWGGGECFSWRQLVVKISLILPLKSQQKGILPNLKYQLKNKYPSKKLS